MDHSNSKHTVRIQFLPFDTICDRDKIKMGTKRKSTGRDKSEKKKSKAKRRSSKEGDLAFRVDKEQKRFAADSGSGSSSSNTVSHSSLERGFSKKSLPFEYNYIMAPMVGASELPFRLLCRKYGAQLCYTPMMIASEFSKSETYRQKEFQTTCFDRPLVCHFAANNPEDFAKAAQLAEPYCDAIDLNLGCPQVRPPHMPFDQKGISHRAHMF